VPTVRYILTGILKNDSHVQKYFGTSKSFETVRGQIASKVGLGYEVVL
jgi:hypothetical protein